MILKGCLFNPFLSSIFKNLQAQVGLPEYLEIRITRVFCGVRVWVMKRAGGGIATTRAAIT
jgi:hypothetical protein